MKAAEVSKLTPMDSVHEQCKECVCGTKLFNPKEVLNCTGDKAFIHPCPLFKYRMGDNKSSLKAMRQTCLMCMGESELLVAECDTENCPLHPYRFGKNPSRKGIGATAEQMAELRARVNVPENVSEQGKLPVE